MSRKGWELIPAQNPPGTETDRLNQSVETVEVQKGAALGKCATAAGRLRRVLVAEDDRDTADSLVALAKLWGYDARPAYDGAAALAMAAAYRPDILISDIAMPQMNGCQLARQMRCHTRFKDALFISVSGHADETHCRLALEAGFDFYLLKPVEPSTLQSLLLLERSRLERPGRSCGHGGLERL
jgi:CheY-like chemotaxis protein